MHSLCPSILNLCVLVGTKLSNHLGLWLYMQYTYIIPMVAWSMDWHTMEPLSNQDTVGSD